MRKLNFKLMRETIEWLHRKKGTSSLVLPRQTPKESYRLFKLFGAECGSECTGVGDYNEESGNYSIPIHVHGKSLMGGEEFMAVHAALGISKIAATVVSGFYSTTPLPEHNGTVIIGPPLINFKKDTQYTLAVHFKFFTSATKRSIAMRFDYSDGTFDAPVINTTAREFKLCFVSDPNKQLVAISSHSDVATNIRFSVNGFGLFEGAYDDYDSIFEQYTGYRATASVEEPLRKIGFSADELDLLKGEVTQKTKAFTIDGGCEINETDEEYIFSIPLPHPARPGGSAVSTLDTIPDGEITALYLSDDGTEMLLKASSISSAANIKTYLSENPISTVYVLKNYIQKAAASIDPELSDEDLTMEILTERAPSRTVAEYV